MVGHDAGSTGMMSIFAPWILSATKGKAMPAKLLPPPTQPMTTSTFFSPNLASCFFASSPMIVWCSRTWLSTLPRL